MGIDVVVNLVTGAIGAGILWILQDIRSRLVRLEAKVEGKLDVDDHDKQSEKCVNSMDKQLKKHEDLLCSHSHTGLATDSAVIWPRLR